MNRRHRSAQLAGRASVQLHTLIFFTGDSAKEDDAYILDIDTSEVNEPSFTVIVPRYGIEGRVKIPLSADDPNLVREPEKHRLLYNKEGTKISLQVFDKVKVKIWVREIQDHQRELVLELVQPSFTIVKATKRELQDDKHSSSKTKKRRS
jgi:exosome complex exonuclease DIS3/RRP44